MSKLSRAELPHDEKGNDPNDHREDPGYPDKIVPVNAMSKFCLNGEANEMRQRMLTDEYVLGRLAVLGQSTAVFSAPNVGKTLLTIALLIERIGDGLDAESVFYVNADDNYRGLVHKLEIAEQHGFQMLAPGHHDFKAEMLPDLMRQLVAAGEASGKVLILDTVKKFCDLMRKDRASQFGNVVREFVSHGGTAIMLAHVNKHRNESGKVIYAGTSDLVDDADCAYTLDTLDENSGKRTVLFECLKARGDVAQEASYTYDAGEGVHYSARLESVESVNDSERAALVRQRMLADRLEKNRDAVDAIKEAIQAGFVGKTELVTEAHKQAGISRARLRKVLAEHTGPDVASNQFWTLEIETKNRNSYRLNWGVPSC